MNSNHKKIYTINLILAFLIAINHAQAQECAIVPTCEELGYKYTEERCEGSAMVKCPFDLTKVFCREKKYSKVCDTVGDVLLENKLCAYDINDLSPSLTPIGIVFDVEKKLAVALDESDVIKWSSLSKDIPDLINYSKREDAQNDPDGKSNTKFIMEHGDANSYETPAADYCYNYSTKGTQKGDWYLPAGIEIMTLGKNRSTINSSLTKLGKTKLSTWYIWSSTEYGLGLAYSLQPGNNIWMYQKSDKSKVRPIIAF